MKKVFLSKSCYRPNAASTLREVVLMVMATALLVTALLTTFWRRNDLIICTLSRERADIEGIKTQLQVYQAHNGHVPTTEQGLKALVHRPSTNPQPNNWRQLMPELPLDPWGTEYQYRYPATKSTQDPYDLFSAGKDRQPGTADDIGNW